MTCAMHAQSHCLYSALHMRIHTTTCTTLAVLVCTTLSVIWLNMLQSRPCTTVFACCCANHHVHACTADKLHASVLSRRQCKQQHICSVNRAVLNARLTELDRLRRYTCAGSESFALVAGTGRVQCAAVHHKTDCVAATCAVVCYNQ